VAGLFRRLRIAILAPPRPCHYIQVVAFVGMRPMHSPGTSESEA
jgi:hypothetical protein